MKYRRDIDGIRAIAVLAVFAFHLGLSFVPGGFVGVDIFFVISGYLIGGIVLDGIRDGSFRLSNFYVRRFKRILPALTVVLLAVSIAVLFLLVPTDLVAYGKTLIAAVFSVANIQFWRGAGYFEHSSMEKPLLHIWSLGVEEQFYLFFPLGALFLYRLRSAFVIPGLVLVAIASFILSVRLTATHPMAAFYLLPGRTWELLVGVILAGTAPGWLKSKTLRNLVAIAGFAAMLYSILGYKVGTPFPGTAALLPCLGAVAVIAAGRDGSNVVGSFLAWQPVVFIGLISYSLYLWHWPLIVLFEYSLPASKLSRPQQAGLFVGAIALATLSWMFVEQPFRKMRVPAAMVFRYSAVSVAATALVGVVMITSRGLPSRYSAHFDELAAYLDYEPGPQFREHRCFVKSDAEANDFAKSGCVTMDASKANVILLGNSHAAHLWQGLSLADPRVNVMQATGSGWNCVPVIYKNETAGNKCAHLFNYVFEDFLRTNKVDLVILSATWEEGEMEPLRDTLAEMKTRSIPVLLVGPGTQYMMPLPRLLAMAYRRSDASLPGRFEETSPLRFDGRLQRVAIEQSADFVSMHDLVCQGECVTAVNDSPLLFDTDHLTPAGSVLVAGRLTKLPAWKKMIVRYEERQQAGSNSGSPIALNARRP